jgi:beta-glucosidase
MRLLAAVLVHAAAAAAAPLPLEQRPWLDARQPVATRVSQLMKAMTLDEKAAQLLHTSIGIDHTLPAVQAALKSGGMGAMTIEANSPRNGTTCGAACRIGRLRELQLAFLNETRLGIPLSFVIETSHCGAAGGTIFPMGVTQGATWNTSLAHEVGEAIAKEARAWGGDRGLSPEINVCNDPRFGRIEENFGGDPAHVSAMTVAAVTGLQGGAAKQAPFVLSCSDCLVENHCSICRDRLGTNVKETSRRLRVFVGDGSAGDYLPDDEHVVCEAKHCCAYGAGGRDGQSADISPKTLHDIYLRPWDAFVQAGGRGMMLAHNELNGVQMHANYAIMTDHFRTELGFKGFFASDAGMSS